MTIVYRRVTDLPEALARAIAERLGRELDGCATTTDALDRVQPHELAIALAELAAATSAPRRVAILSAAQAAEVKERGESAQAIMAMRQWTWEIAHRRPVPLYERGRGQGLPEAVICLLLDGSLPRIGGAQAPPPARVTVRCALPADLAAWVRDEARQREIPQGAVIEDALRRARDGRRGEWVDLGVRLPECACCSKEMTNAWRDEAMDADFCSLTCAAEYERGEDDEGEDMEAAT